MANEEYDFFIDVSKKGSTSFRADGKVDVSLIAQKLADGGGHPNAAGCYFEDFKETINYEDVKKFIQTKLDSLN
jgi:oligoribonuclease NrnB/cAMP/cGMP phosphodiesterase (DHH superfamily)